MKKVKFRIISMMLIFAFLVQMVLEPNIASAVTKSNETVKDVENDADVDAASGSAVDMEKNTAKPVSGSAVQVDNSETKPTNEPQVVSEEKDKRTINSKTFLMSDNSCKMVMYSEPVHYKKNGEFKDIDNTLIEKQEGIYQNKSNSFKVSIAENKDADKLVSVKSGDLGLSWGYDSKAQDVEAVTPAGIGSENTMKSVDGESSQESNDTERNPNVEIHNTETQTETTDITAFDNTKVSSSATYQDIDNNTDLNYQVESNNVKEKIVLNQPTEVKAYKFKFYTKDLIASVNKNGDIEFKKKNSKKVIYMIPKGFMYDSNQKYSGDVQYELEKIEEGYILSVIPNQDWLNAGDRIYPITIDPTVTTSQSKGDISITAVNNTTGDVYNNKILVGNDSGNNYSTYMNFKLPVFESNIMIRNAELFMCPDDFKGKGSSRIYAKISDYWYPFSKGSQLPSVDTNVIDYEDVNPSSTSFSLDVSKLVTEWNHRVIKIIESGIQLSTNNQDSLVQFFSEAEDDTSEYDVLRPCISIDYQVQNGIESYCTYKSQNLGRAGTSYVNTQSGNLTVVENDISMNGNRMPISFSHVYNSSQSTQQANGDSLKREDKWYTNSSMKVGNGWRLSCCQRLLKLSGKNEISKTTPYKLIDADGTEHYFYDKDGDGSGTDYVDEDGLGYTLTIVDQDNEHYYKIVDKAKNTIWFDVWSYMRENIDSNGNYIHYNYGPGSDGYSNFLDNITDSSGRGVKFNYSNHFLDNIVDASGRSTTFTYDTDGYLTQITFPDKKSVTYEYNDSFNPSKKISKITNTDGYSVLYSYELFTSKVNGFYESGKDGSTGNYFNAKYDINQTTFTDNKGRVTKYLFDNDGNTVNIQDDKGNAEMYDYEKEGDTKNIGHKVSNYSSIDKPVYNLLSNSSFENNLDNWNEERWIPASGLTVHGSSDL